MYMHFYHTVLIGLYPTNHITVQLSHEGCASWKDAVGHVLYSLPPSVRAAPPSPH